MFDFIKKIVGTKNEREVKRIRPIVEKIGALEPEHQKLTDAELRRKTDEFRERIKEATAGAQAALDEAEARAAAASASCRRFIGVVPAWLAKPVAVQVHQWIPTMPCTTPMGTRASSRTAPCSMCNSRYPATVPGRMRASAKRAGSWP